MWGGYHDMMGGYGGTVMWIFWIVIVIAAVYLLAGSPRSGNSGTAESPLDILKKRYARGEISEEEFEKIKQDIEK